MTVDRATQLMQELTSALSTEYSTMIQRNVDLVNRMKSLSNRHQAIIEQYNNNLSMIESSIAAVEQFRLGTDNVKQIESIPEVQSNRKRARL